MQAVDGKGIRIGVRVASEPSRGERRIQLRVQFDPGTLRFAHANKGRLAELALGFYEENAKGKIVAAHQQAFTLSPTLGASKSVGFSAVIPPQQEASTLVLVLALRDLTTGVTGSVRIRLRKYQTGSSR